MLAIGVDVGGTKVAAGVVTESGEVLARLEAPTPSTDPGQVVATIAEVVARLRAAHQVGAVGLGAAGFVDATGSRVRFAVDCERMQFFDPADGATIWN